MANNKTSLGPYDYDSVIYNHKGRVVNSIVNSQTFDDKITNIDKTFYYDFTYLPNDFKKRPDLIANSYYGSPINWWLVLFVNNIADPFESLDANQRILLPRLK